jgi:hypothetical protein
MQIKQWSDSRSIMAMMFMLGLLLPPAAAVDDIYVKAGATGSGSSWDDATSSVQAVIDGSAARAGEWCWECSSVLD